MLKLIVISIFLISNVVCEFKLKDLIDNSKNINEAFYQPEQIHISYGGIPSQMIITWTTLSYVSETFVEYGSDIPNITVKGTYRNFGNGGKANRTVQVHQVLLTNLIPGHKYRYHVGSPTYAWSDLYYFTAMRVDQDWQPRFAVFGDMGNKNAKSMSMLQEETMKGNFDAILHVGDFAYDMVNEDGLVGDAFMNQIQSIAAYVPYMTCVGNHENAYNFSQYVNRFNMPNSDGKTFGGDNNHFYSFNIGPIHIISFSTEFYYYTGYGFDQIANQYRWLQEDLTNANKPENRAKQPWIITMGHRPMYCTNLNKDDCVNRDDRVRKGMPYIFKYGLEDLFYNNGVDLELWAHEHSYERLYPIYDYKIMNGSAEEPFTNPKAPVHIITGSAGCQENHNPFRPSSDISVFRSDDYGYSRMQVFNSTHLHFEQVSIDKDGEVIDEFWLIKDDHYKN